MASSSSSAVDPSPKKYDVFISFAGETRNSFTSHLYFALFRKHIRAYIDEVSLEKGDDISGALQKAIEESSISIIIFSENYASSSWCLNELVHILKCSKEKGQIVLPIFHGIDPSHIRKQEGSYAAAFVKHEERFKEKMNKVQEWRQALNEAAGLSGWDSRDKSESALVETVVGFVLRKLISIWPSIDDLKGLVGIPRRLKKIESLLCVGSPDVCTLGIWGMGGIGKTTLARVVFRQLSDQFEGSCFVSNVREESQKQGLRNLVNKVFCKLLGEEKLDVFNPVVDVRLRGRKLLLVLDDVDNFELSNHLRGIPNLFGKGSKIIVTSRDLQVLKQFTTVRYEVEALDFHEALELFYLKAFKENSLRTGHTEISKRVVSYAKGNPLALEDLGSSLYTLGIKDWESALDKLKRIPNLDIMKVLRISYDGLDAEERDIFLDIACFLKNEKRVFVERILEHKSIIGITVLVNKSLITIKDGRIRMHDLIQEMGWEIVRQSTNKLGKRSRLWDARDISYVLKNNKGTEAIEGIYLDVSKIEEELCLRPEVFEEMNQLRLLKIYSSNFDSSMKCKVYINGAHKYLPDSLRYLCWFQYLGKSLPSNFNPQNLVELHMSFSNLEQLWDGVRKFGSLKHMDLSFSEHLTKIPDLSLAPKPRRIVLDGCAGLIHVPVLNFQGNLDESEYNHAKNSIASVLRNEITPGFVSFNNCHNLKTLSKVFGNITMLELCWTALEEFPSSIESLENLFCLNLFGCEYLKSLPKLPRNLEALWLDEVGIEQIPSSSIECLSSLREVSLTNCKRLDSLPSNIWKSKALEKIDLCGCSKLRNLPEISNHLEFLCTLNLTETSIKELPSSIENLIGLHCLYLDRCEHLEIVPETLCKLTRLRILSAHHCSKLKSFPMLSGLCSLTSLDLSCCNIREIPYWLGSLTSLTTLDLHGNIFDRMPSTIGKLYKQKYFDYYETKLERFLRDYFQPLPMGRLLKDTLKESDDCTNADFESRRTAHIDSDTDYVTVDEKHQSCEILTVDSDSEEPLPKRTRYQLHNFFNESPSGKEI